MALATRRRSRIVLVLLLALVALVAVDLAHLRRLDRLNAAIAADTVPDIGEPDRPEVRFAQARALTNRDPDAGLAAYRALQGDTPLGLAARYNSANALLRQAIKVRATTLPGQAIPLIELAKETYREVLRKSPGLWDARYNLERAQRLLPDPEDADDTPAMTPNNSERAVTTMRGVSPGLP